FGGIHKLHKDAVIKVTTGQGEFEFHVIGVRHEGDAAPPGVAKGSARLTLITAEGAPFLPNGVVRVDADLKGDPVGGTPPLIPSPNLPAEERIRASDTRTLWALALWMHALIALSVGAVWACHRWGRAQAWVVFLPPLLLVGLMASEEASRLLPNLM